MNIMAQVLDFGAYYGMIGMAQTKAIMACAAITLVLAAVQLIVGRIRGRND